eukprot:TRINITY_DN2234_c0_g1_i3.p1 TRINITY_DN2234_c0_g1~~TRINITY_DN2234_c0_g1_i3.p1  ORF type:complete len:402 (+),score=113.64 TRINITY_DN2234_c0_g1_i3:112-1206(+)
MADFYGDEGDENLDYSKKMDDFYADTGEVQGDLEFQSFDQALSRDNAPQFEGLGQGYGGYGASGASFDPAAGGGGGGGPVPGGGGGGLEGEYSFVDFAQPPQQGAGAQLEEDVSDMFTGGPEGGPEDEDPSKTRFWNISYYSFLFDVDTSDVLKRLLYSVFIYPSFLDTTGDRPDLYGPFWISTTLIFVLGAMGNFATYASYVMKDREDEWEYDFSKVTFGALLIYCYLAIVPILFWTGFKYLDAPIGMLDSYCLFGYSLFAYVPASLAMVVPNEWARWGMVALAALVISAFYARNIFPRTRSIPLACAGLIACAVVCNIFLAVLLRLYFFEYVGALEKSSEATPAPPPPAPETMMAPPPPTPA